VEDSRPDAYGAYRRRPFGQPARYRRIGHAQERDGDVGYDVRYGELQYAPVHPVHGGAGNLRRLQKYRFPRNAPTRFLPSTRQGGRTLRNRSFGKVFETTEDMYPKAGLRKVAGKMSN